MFVFLQSGCIFSLLKEPLIEQSESNTASHVTKRIEQCQEQSSQHFEERFVSHQTLVEKNISSWRAESNSNHQSVYSGLSQLKGQVNSVLS